MQERLLQLLESMDVPALRRSVELHHLRWLDRNLAIRNGGHADFREAIHLVQTLIRELSRS